jgi:hypothetical protein
MRWAGHVAHMERREKCARFWRESPKERDLSEDRGVDVRMGSEWMLGRLLPIMFVCILSVNKNIKTRNISVY